MITEIFKPIKGYEGIYEVSNFGRVKSLPKKRSGRWGEGEIMMVTRIGARGYFVVGLKKDRKRKLHTIHRLIAIAFIPNPKNLPQINHKDGVKTNNRIENLEWCTPNENAKHAYESGLCRVDWSKKKVAQIKDGKILKIWESGREIERCLHIKYQGVSECCRGRIKSSCGFQWEFVN